MRTMNSKNPERGMVDQHLVRILSWKAIAHCSDGVLAFVEKFNKYTLIRTKIYISTYAEECPCLVLLSVIISPPARAVVRFPLLRLLRKRQSGRAWFSWPFSLARLEKRNKPGRMEFEEHHHHHHTNAERALAEVLPETGWLPRSRNRWITLAFQLYIVLLAPVLVPRS